MKISKSKQELARIISENGGWRDGAESAAQSSSDNAVSFYLDTASRFCNRWYGKHMIGGDIEQDGLISNWHQTVLSRAEYFHLYPAPDADGWIEWEGGECPVDVGSVVDVKHRDGDIGIRRHAGLSSSEPDSDGNATAEDWSHLNGGGDIISYRLRKPGQAGATDKLSSEAVSAAKIALMSDSIEELVRKPTIEQLAADYRNAKDYADRKQKEADDVKADANEALRKLEIAGEAIGLIVTPITAKQKPELVITDWRDLREGDVIKLTAGERYNETECTICTIPGRVGLRAKSSSDDEGEWWNLGGIIPSDWKFIRRP